MKRPSTKCFPFMSLRHILFILLGFLIACSNEIEQKHFTIGFSQCVESDVWRKTMLEEMKRELGFYPNISFIYKHAEANSQKQIAQVKELLTRGIDILIISPNEAEPLTAVVEETFNKGIPVIVVDRKISSPSYTAYVGGNNYEIGKMAGLYAVHLLKGRGKIIEVTGLPKSSAAIERRRGFSEALNEHPGLKIVQQLNGEWIKPTAQRELSKVVGLYPDVDLVFAHNDMMALGTYEIYKNNGVEHKPMIIGVDGLPGKERGMQFVTDKKITATMLYPTGGEEAIQIAVKILNKEAVEKENLLQTTVIDSTNVHLMELQAGKMTSQQQEIERQQAMLTEQRRIYKNQRNLLYILVSSLAMALGLGGIAFYSLRENRKINKKLQLQNDEILSQKNLLIEMSAKAQAANEAKVNFFTNISHEFRTPLMLILGPIDELLANPKVQHSSAQSLTMVQKNAIRLLRLVNQLMDFRKIEVDKMKVQASEDDLVPFISGIIQSYKSIAHKRNIDLRMITHENHLNVWFDKSMLDKVIFNLLSNAFKFTNDNGYVHVYVNKSEDGKEAIIKVEDNGVGMTKEAVDHAFELFYQGEYENYKGSGLGLALSKDLIHLHKGSIAVTSKKWKGCNFEIRLLLGNDHFQRQEVMAVEAKLPGSGERWENEKIYTTDLETGQATKEGVATSIREKDHSILIIEDDNDLRCFLHNRLQKDYEILEANNGQSALQQAFDSVPDLIVCDVIIPQKNGMALTNIFKTDVRTSHIPVILLTIKTEIEEQIEGMKNMADAYITKPFNLQFLELTIKSLLVNRTRLKEHFVGDLSSTLKTQTASKLDRKFINEFTAIVESNLSNEKFNIEDICKTMGISRIQLYRKVKALLSINVYEYIINARLQKAKYLLQNEEFTVSEIAYQVGFSSPAYFSTVFKSKFGVTPKSFKEK